MTKQTGTFLDDIKTTGDGEELKQVLKNCSKHKLNMLSSVAKKVKNDKYGKSGTTTRNLRGQRSEVFTDSMLNDLFINMKIPEQWRVTTILQLFLCLRPSEVQSVELVKGYWRERDGTEHDAFHIWNEKCDRDEYKPAPRFIKQVFFAYQELVGPDGYTAAYLNKIFSQMRERLGYPWNDENPEKRADGATSYLYSNKSIRHTSRALFGDAVNNDPYKVAHHMHHSVESHVGTQGAYGRYDPEEWKQDLKEAFMEYYELARANYDDRPAEKDNLFDGV